MKGAAAVRWRARVGRAALCPCRRSVVVAFSPVDDAVQDRTRLCVSPTLFWPSGARAE